MDVNKIYCGDSYEMIKSIPNKSIDLIITDPPYGINADKGVGGFGSSPNKASKYNDSWDNKTPPKWLFDELLRIGKKVIIFGGNYFTDKLPQSNHWIVWDKQGGIEFKNPFSACELIWTNIDKNNVTKYIQIQQGFIKDGFDERVHPTQKPLDLLKRIITDYSKQNDIILDPFMGSGTTIIACKELNRNYIGIEINEKYYDIVKDRLNGIFQQEKIDKEHGIQTIFDFLDSEVTL